MTFKTRFGSMADYQKGGVEVINDDPRSYVFSNVFDVASRSKPWERVAVAKNFEYVIEAARAAGESPYWTARDSSLFVTKPAAPAGTTSSCTLPSTSRMPIVLPASRLAPVASI